MHGRRGWGSSDPAGQFVVLPLTDVLLYPPMDAFIRAAARMKAVVGLVLRELGHQVRLVSEDGAGVRGRQQERRG